MEAIFSDRIQDVPRSFIREILKVTLDPEVISFAGGLPNRQFFPFEKLKEAAAKVFEEEGTGCLQYSNSEGLLELRQFIAEQYSQNHSIDLDTANILITNGSQQALDLIAKITINDGDQVVIEEPGYLGAIQALTFYRPQFLPVPVNEEGMECSRLQEVVRDSAPKLMYTVPNFQNPSGISYTQRNREDISKILAGKQVLLVEDDPYGALRFRGKPVPSFYHYLPEQTLLLGSFSKVVAPGFRLGWIVAPDSIFEKLLIAKQAADLHTSNFSQFVIQKFLRDNDLHNHVQTIKEVYGRQCAAMLDAIDTYFPKDVTCTRPDGGMFLWGTLPDQLSALELFEIGINEKVAFVPGDPFYTTVQRTSSFRLNFSCVNETLINDGIQRLGKAIESLLVKA